MEQSADVIAAELESALGVWRHNWSRALQIVREFRDSKSEFDQDQLVEGFVDLSPYRFRGVAHYRFKELTDSEIVWNTYQLAMVFLTSANAVATEEIPSVIKYKLTGESISKNIQEIVDHAFKRLTELNQESHKFWQILTTVSVAISELEQQRLDFSKVKIFKDNLRVRSAMTDLYETFKKELKPE